MRYRHARRAQRTVYDGAIGSTSRGCGAPDLGEPKVARRTIRIKTTIRREIKIRRTVTVRPIYQPAPVRLQPVSPPRLTSTTVRRSSTAPLGAIREAVAAYADADASADADEDKAYDVFVCHASEDQADVVRPLVDALVAEGLTPWYSEFVLHIGSRLRRTIDAGLAKSRFGLVVLSPSFFAKEWPAYELDGLVTREIAGGEQLILPVWHNVTKTDVMGYSPSLADKLARSTAEHDLSEIAREIAEVIRG